MKKNKILSLITLMLLLILTVSGCGKKEETIVMGTNAEFPPFEYVEANEVKGFDIELSKKIAEKVGVKLEIENMSFEGLIPALESGKIDFIAAGMTATEERAQYVNFSKNYFEAAQVIIVLKNQTAINSVDDLSGKKLGVQLGTTSEIEAQNVENASVESYNTAYGAIMDLINGKIDAVILDQEPAKNFVNENGEIKILDKELAKEAYAIAVNKENEELLKQINEVIDELKENGEYDKLYNEFFNK